MRCLQNSIKKGRNGIFVPAKEGFHDEKKGKKVEDHFSKAKKNKGKGGTSGYESRRNIGVGKKVRGSKKNALKIGKSGQRAGLDWCGCIS